MTQEQENLLAAYFANQLTQEEKAQLLSLLDTDKEFADGFRQMEQAYAAACMPAFEKTREQDYRKLESRMGRHRNIISFWRPMAVAASIAAILSLGAAIYATFRFQDDEQFLSQAQVTTITSTLGTGTQTMLPDGTHACINAGSSLSFGRSFGRGGRDVTLEGEGYFEVAHDAANPFRVHAGNTCVTVKGTVFNVRSYPEEANISVSLLEGSVLLSTPADEVTLTPGTCAVVSRESGQIRLEKVNHTATGWTKGKIAFTDQSIPEILATLQRNYGVSFVYEEGLFGEERFTGILSSSLSVDEILSYIDVDHKFTWQRNDDSIEIHKK